MSQNTNGADASDVFESIVDEAQQGLRLDVYLAGEIEDASRSFLKKVIKDGGVSINGSPCRRPSRAMALGEAVRAEMPPPPSTDAAPEDIPLEILYQDADVVVVNKPAGLVVHPAPGHYTGTLVNAVLFHCPDFKRPGGEADRPGIVHRLDQYTSGVLVVAKSPRAFTHLSQQAREHTFDRRYLALVSGEFKEERGRIDAPMGRSTADPTRMTITGLQGRDAVTHFEVLERFGCASLVGLQLETGRTHQVRVHLRYAGRPVLGDTVYGVSDFSKWPVRAEAKEILRQLEGQALHAERLGFTHPATGERLSFSAPLPPDFQNALDVLREGRDT